MAACRARGHEIEVRQLVTAMRQAEPTRDIAELALSYRHDGVAGFDIAGLRRVSAFAVPGVLSAAAARERLLHHSCR